MNFSFKFRELESFSLIYLVTSITFYLFIYLFICIDGLFKTDISSSDCIASNGMIIVNNQLEMMEKEAVVACLR
jgi:hypothetical protein